MLSLVGLEVHIVHNSIDYRYTKVGEFVCLEDGFYRFFPEPYEGGYWPGYILRFIADTEEELNKEWNETIANDPVLQEG